MRVLVTGGAGYIGSHTVKLLTEKGFEVFVYDNFSTGHRAAVGEVPLIEGDLFDVELLDKTLAEKKIEAVVHFAAFSLVGESMTMPAKYYTNNVAGTIGLISAMSRRGVDKLVFSSTAAVYGEPGVALIDEELPKNPTNVYGRTKLIMEQAMADYSRAYGLRYIPLRYFNACGADASGKIGEDHLPETHLIPRVLQTCLGQYEAISIFGDDYSTPDGTCVRDYIHVTDLAQAHYLALKALGEGAPSTVYNLGNGMGFSVKEIVEAAEKVTGITLKKIISERRPGDPAILVASSEKIRRELGWKPEQTDIKEIIATAWEWHRKHPFGYNDRT